MLATRMRMAGAIGDIALIDDGDAAPSSGTGGTAHTYSSQTSTGPTSVLAITWVGDGALRTLSSATWNGNAMSILVQRSTGSNWDRAAFVAISGAQSGAIVLNFSGNVSDSHITKISLTNVQSLTPLDTDSAEGEDAALSLASLSSPGEGGIRLAAIAGAADTVDTTWTNATEIADLDAGVERHSVAYDLGDDGTTISADNDGFQTLVGVSIR